jgi:hypothetical protein
MSGDSQRIYNCILVKKNGTLKQLRPLNPDEMTQPNYVSLSETSETYEALFRLHAAWNVKKYGAVVELWARTTGRAGQENMYEFPPPVDETLFFGNCLLVLAGSSSPSTSFTLDAWKQIYSTLFGGFHNLDKLKHDDETEYDELDDLSEKYKTKEGYLKDGFIVEDGTEKIQKPGARKRLDLNANSSNPKPKSKLQKNKMSPDDAAAAAAMLVLSSSASASASASSSSSGQYKQPAHEVELEEEPYEDES